MFILSQDEKTLVNVNNVLAFNIGLKEDWETGTSWVVYYENPKGQRCTLGTYVAEEDARKALNGIKESILRDSKLYNMPQ